MALNPICPLKGGGSGNTSCADDLALKNVAVAIIKEPTATKELTCRNTRAISMLSAHMFHLRLTKTAKPPPMAGRKQEVLQLRE